MRYTNLTKPQNKKILSLLERADKQAGSSGSLGSADAQTGASAGNAFTGASASGSVGVGINLTQAQKSEAELVGKLHGSFPIDGWEKLSTKEQLQAMKFSGLNEQDQWKLLNASTNLSVLADYNAQKAGAIVNAVNSSDIRNSGALGIHFEEDQSKLNPANPSKLPSLQTQTLSVKMKNQGIAEQLAAKILGMDRPATTPNSAVTPLPQPGPTPEIDVRTENLYNQLKKKVDQDLSILERVKGNNTTYEALNVVLQNNSTIQAMSAHYHIPKAILQTIMFREQRFIDARDWLADVLVGYGITKQSSTGIMQVTTKTAIEAINYAVSKQYTTFAKLGLNTIAPLSYLDGSNRTLVWDQLRNNPEFNIEVAAQVIRMNADAQAGNKKIEDYSPSELITLLARYNGTGSAAQEYGAECYDWFQTFDSFH